MTKTNAQNQSERQDTRFSKAALDYMDALFELERKRNDVLLAKALTQPSGQNHATTDHLNTVKDLHLTAEDSAFIGGGWSAIENGSTPYRWMGRLAGVLLPVDLTNGGMLTLTGTKSTRRKWAKGLKVALAGQDVKGQLSMSLSGAWQFEARIPAMANTANGPHILTLRTAGQSREYILFGERKSLAVTSLSFSATS